MIHILTWPRDKYVVFCYVSQRCGYTIGFGKCLPFFLQIYITSCYVKILRFLKIPAQTLRDSPYIRITNSKKLHTYNIYYEKYKSDVFD